MHSKILAFRCESPPGRLRLAFRSGKDNAQGEMASLALSRHVCMTICESGVHRALITLTLARKLDESYARRAR